MKRKLAVGWTHTGFLAIALSATLVLSGCFERQPGMDWNPSTQATAAPATPAPNFIDYEHVFEGLATSYLPSGAGNCGYGEPSADDYVASVSNTDYAGSYACGAFIRVYGPQGSVTVRVVDRCPECAPGEVVLTKPAFKQVAGQSIGVVDVQWHFTEGLIGGPVGYRLKPDSNQHWMALQITNHRHPIVKVEMARPAGKWVTLQRQVYNYFTVDRPMGDGPWDVRVTDILGQTVKDVALDLTREAVIYGQAQLPPLDDAPRYYPSETELPMTAPTDIDVDVIVNAASNFGYCAGIFVRNATEDELQWFAQIEFDGEIEQVYSCAHTINNNTLTVFGHGIGQTLPPGMATDCGFCSRH